MSALPENFWSALPLGREVRLLTHDANGLAAFAKPAGVLSHPNVPRDEARSLLTARYEIAGEFFTWPHPPAGENAVAPPRRLWLLNRLDSATSGVILAAADEALARAIKTQFARREIRKVYNALVFGAPAVAAQVWRDRLAVEKRDGVIRTGTAGLVPAESQCQVIQAHPGTPPLALLQLTPKTGRSHQLRVQCARRHLPIVGDQTYGDFRRNREFARRTGWKRLFLHSLETSFEYAFDGRHCTFQAAAPLPGEFAAALAGE